MKKSGFRAGEIVQYEDNEIVKSGLIVSKVSYDKYILANSKQSQSIKDYSVLILPEDILSGQISDSLIFNLADIRTIKKQQIKQKIAELKQYKIAEVLKIQAKILSKTYYDTIHSQKEKFEPGITKINYGGRVFDEKEIFNLIDASLDFWLTAGKYACEFEEKLAEFIGVKYSFLVNSGSSANLLAFMTLTSPKLGERKIERGDEVITVSASFPTTVAPIIQYGAIPVFVDISIPDYNIDCSMLEKALSEKTKAVMLAHTLGNPFDIEKVKGFCEKNNLWLIEDNCDALGSKYFYKRKWKYTGSFGDLATLSFYPAHHITTGEGGAVFTNNPELAKIVNSLRDWGRDCWCTSGKDNTCGKRFGWQLGELPYGYDHKYIYSHFGYNLKMTDLQAAIGCAQIEKLPFFIEKRRENWTILRKKLDTLSDFFILPEATLNSKPCWFGFVLTVRDGKKISRDSIVKYLENSGVQTRMLFSGNLIKHPCFDELRKSGKGFRVVGELSNTDKIMNDSFWIGVYPGITEQMIDYIVEKIKSAVNFIQN